MFHVVSCSGRRGTSAWRSTLCGAVDQQTISEAFGEASSLWQGWIYTRCCHGVGVPFPMLQPGSFLSRRGGPVGGLAYGAGCACCSADTRAIARHADVLPEAACQELVRRSGRELEALKHRQHGCGGVSGCASSMVRRSPCPIRPRIKPSIRRPRRRSPGCGLPIARVLVVVFVEGDEVCGQSQSGEARPGTAIGSSMRRISAADCWLGRVARVT